MVKHKAITILIDDQYHYNGQLARQWQERQNTRLSGSTGIISEVPPAQWWELRRWSWTADRHFMQKLQQRWANEFNLVVIFNTLDWEWPEDLADCALHVEQLESNMIIGIGGFKKHLSGGRTQFNFGRAHHWRPDEVDDEAMALIDQTLTRFVKWHEKGNLKCKRMRNF